MICIFKLKFMILQCNINIQDKNCLIKIHVNVHIKITIIIKELI